MSIRAGIVGISGFGGGEAMRLVASHPSFELVYAAGKQPGLATRICPSIWAGQTSARPYAQPST